jgi:hypothetical protein
VFVVVGAPFADGLVERRLRIIFVGRLTRGRSLVIKWWLGWSLLRGQGTLSMERIGIVVAK